MENKRLEKILEICMNNELKFLDVMEIYTRFSSKVYVESVKKGEQFQLYNPILEERTMKLTERYFNIKKIRDLNRTKLQNIIDCF